ncbi:YcbX family protein [Martelella alba]|uniref:MOSC domain-containing protein n=1 Tax=Martelella alba TaxID=2590451 RepID=A0ABY2SPI2_9HYPH|nr:YcbX family protein [Martelella alba]TKI07513.1 MOSC domain-containing protein [Martelella alba]
MLSLSRIYIHPVKSMRGMQVSHALVSDQGLAGDRCWMLTETDGTFITARQFPQMVLFTPVAVADGVHIGAPDGSGILARYADFTASAHPTEVWGNHFNARIAADAVNHWLSGYFHRPVQLRWTGPQSSRRVKRYPEIPLSFADGFPYLLINEASFNDLQRRCPSGIKLAQFRPNLVITGAEPYAEDRWRTLRIGEEIFEVTKPCSRCVLTTVNIERGCKHAAAEPLRTLRRYRTADNGDVDFGLNMLSRGHGIIRLGDKVEIIDEHAPRRYGPGQIGETFATPEGEQQNVQIDYKGRTFTGNNRQVLLEQLEQQGIRVPYSCRAGLCGTCRVALQTGEVAPLTASAVEKPGSVLACSCIPKTDLRLG